MGTPTIADTLKYVNLQMAAEAFLRDPDTKVLHSSGQDLIDALVTGNNHASHFTKELATQFADQWTVIDQKINTATGFSGTLFQAIKDDPTQNIKAGDFVISFRSTEFIDDAVRDNLATNTMEIKDTGFAWGQLADMQAWYAGLTAAGGPLSAGQKVTVTGYSLGGHLATAFNLLHGSGELKEAVTSKPQFTWRLAA